MFYLGIDPGKSGGIAVLSPTGVIDCTVKMPQTEADLYHLLRSFEGDGRAMVEHVHASPQMGVVSAFTFGKGYGALLMALTAAKIKFDEVSPRKWQAAMQCLTKGDKNVSKRRAQQLFPQLTITHATADALLIAEFCRRWHCSLDVNGSSRARSQQVTAAGSGRDTATATASCIGEAKPEKRIESRGRFVKATSRTA